MRRIIIGLTVAMAFATTFSPRLDAQSAAPAKAVSILEYGAIPDRDLDSTAAIKAAIAAAKAKGLSVFVPSGTFIHKSFSLDGVSLSGVGPASVLLAPRPTDSNIYLRGSRPSIRNITIRVKSSHRDSKNFAIFIDGADAFTVDAVSIDGGNAGGIFDYGGHHGLIAHNQVRNTLADAIHNTHGAHDIIVAENTVRHAGDDMIAVVSYAGEPPSHDILIENNDLADQTYGRGISVVGGQDVTIQGNKVARTNCCAGIYLAAERAWVTLSVRNVLVRENVLTDNSGRTGHGAIMLYADRGSVRDIALERNTIVHARHAAITLFGTVGNVTIVDNHFVDPAGGGITGAGKNIYCAGNTLNGSPVVAALCRARQATKVPGARLASFR